MANTKDELGWFYKVIIQTPRVDVSLQLMDSICSLRNTNGFLSFNSGTSWNGLSVHD